jgi:hypothetical protein
MGKTKYLALGGLAGLGLLVLGLNGTHSEPAPDTAVKTVNCPEDAAHKASAVYRVPEAGDADAQGASLERLGLAPRIYSL